MESLTRQYDVYVRETTENNYATGKVEKLYRGYISHEELMRKYPTEVEKLIKYYRPEFDDFFFEKDGSPKYSDMSELYNAGVNLRYKDILFFREFIDRNRVFEEYVITDREYTAVSDKLRRYVPRGAIRDIAGTFTGFSISYEKYLMVKKLYPKEIALLASQESNDEDIRHFINEAHPYLTQHEIHYMV